MTSSENNPPGRWLLFIGMFLISVPQALVHVVDLSGRSDFKFSADVPPLYFIQRDFNEGVGAAIGIVIATVICVLLWRRYPVYSHMTLWGVYLWSGYHIVRALVIYARCQHLFDPQYATSFWKDFDAYHSDHWIRVGFYVGPIPGLLIAWFMRPRAKGNEQDPVDASVMKVSN